MMAVCAKCGKRECQCPLIIDAQREVLIARLNKWYDSVVLGSMMSEGETTSIEFVAYTDGSCDEATDQQIFQFVAESKLTEML